MRASPRRSPESGNAPLALKPSGQEAAQLRPGSLSSVSVIGQQHAHNLSASTELGQVKGVSGAGIDHELHNVGRLLLREPLAIRRGSHFVLRANDDKRGYAERRASQVGAWRVKSSSRPEAGRA